MELENAYRWATKMIKGMEQLPYHKIYEQGDKQDWCSTSHSTQEPGCTHQEIDSGQTMVAHSLLYFKNHTHAPKLPTPARHDGGRVNLTTVIHEQLVHTRY